MDFELTKQFSGYKSEEDYINKINELSLELEKERKKRSESEEELERFLETATDLYGVMVDYGEDDFRLKKFNSTWTKTLGWSEEEFSDMSPMYLVHPDDVERMSKVIKILYERGTKAGIVARYRCKNGEYKSMEWKWNYVEYDNSIILTGKDISEEKRLEEEKKQLEEAIVLESLKTEFFANMSHEFKTPLNIIIATVQLIHTNLKKWDVADKDKMGNYIKGIQQNSYRLLRLVNNLIDMTKIDGGYYELRPLNCNIVSVVEEIISSVAEYIGNKGRKLIFDTDEEEVILACDPEKIERIMFNLLSNSLKYTDENGNIKVNLKIDRENEKVIVSVKDDGIGISEEYAKIIFERFSQEDNLLSRRCEGSGIGLSLVKSLAEMHGGHVWVNTELKKGTELLFDIPIRKVEDKGNVKLYAKEIDSKIERCNIEFSDIYTV